MRTKWAGAVRVNSSNTPLPSTLIGLLTRYLPSQVTVEQTRMSTAGALPSKANNGRGVSTRRFYEQRKAIRTLRGLV